MIALNFKFLICVLKNLTNFHYESFRNWCTLLNPSRRSGQAWWRHQMEAVSALLALCAGNSPVTGEFPTQRPVTQSFDVFFDLPLNKRLDKQSCGWWFETPSYPLWHHRNVKRMVACTPVCISVQRNLGKPILKSRSVNKDVLTLVVIGWRMWCPCALSQIKSLWLDLQIRTSAPSQYKNGLSTFGLPFKR